MKCADCKFFEVMPSKENLGGHCHRYPPQLVFEVLEPLGPGQSRQWFPYMEIDSWCGEFQEALHGDRALIRSILSDG